jgi:hypothetical protein
MTKTGRREAKSEARKQKWNDWRRGRTKGWFSRKTLAFVIFGLCVAVGIVLAFTIPRVPSFSFNADKPLTNASSEWAEKVPTVWLRSPANFSFAAFADLRLEPGENFLPLHLTKIHARIYDGQTGRQVAEGIIKDQKFPAHKKTPLSLPLNFSYAAVNDSDQTCKSCNFSFVQLWLICAVRAQLVCCLQEQGHVPGQQTARSVYKPPKPLCFAITYPLITNRN